MNPLRLLRTLVAWLSLAAMPAQADLADRFGGTNYVRIITAPKSVTAWKTVGAFTPAATVEDFSNSFKKAGTGVPVSSNLVARLTKILLDERSYTPPEWRDHCVHLPDLVLTFANDDRSLDVFFCLGCEIMLVQTGGVDPKASLLKDDAPNAIICLMKEIFPKDPQIQAIRESTP